MADEGRKFCQSKTKNCKNVLVEIEGKYKHSTYMDWVPGLALDPHVSSDIEQILPKISE